VTARWRFQVHPHQITVWKHQALAVLPEVFSRKREFDQARQSELLDELYAQIGRLKVELDWVKIRSGLEPHP
jgi:transposase